jgi:hypothetical protein
MRTVLNNISLLGKPNIEPKTLPATPTTRAKPCNQGLDLSLGNTQINPKKMRMIAGANNLLMK